MIQPGLIPHRLQHKRPDEVLARTISAGRSQVLIFRLTRKDLEINGTSETSGTQTDAPIW